MLVLFLALVLVAIPVLGKKGDVSVSYAYIHLTVTNEAPVISSLALGPAPVYEDTDIECAATATDREGDEVGYTYQWYVNDVEIGYSGPVLPNEYVNAGDTVACEATPHDSFAEGVSGIVSSAVVAVPVQTKVVKTTLAAALMK